ncbi:magnesium chelatase subunit D [Sulfitobacter sabulilitoris]|uniref:Magnesium chelatase subunit D n=1 Tax=Sulfitobacter sabulilitoris TaxID=2562655 RepID=A0A5S3PCZ0_9RHOB|nr:magnesium chelatase subunit D [Sulfitobacter sabulilitoris]TMM50635.1 magnesium chelatase subunit D [Sulfitobacter sabulilitoris]
MDLGDSWQRAHLALRLLAIDPSGLGGAVIRMRASPDRDALLHALGALPHPVRRIHPAIADDQLFGGLDLSATLKTGQVSFTKGFFQSPATLLLIMAERCDRALAGKLSQQIDQTTTHCLIALDEGADDQENAPASLADRLAFHIEPAGRRPIAVSVPAGTGPDTPATVKASGEDIQTLSDLATHFGISSLRAPILALRAARAHASLHGRVTLDQSDLEAAAALVYPHRATRVPDPQDRASPPPAPSQDANGTDDTETALPDGDMLIDAVKAALPPGLLEGGVPAGTTSRASGAGAGQARKSNRRGRPLPSRPGRLDGRNRIDLVATLRAAAPWQTIRRKARPDVAGLIIRPADIRVKRHQDHSDRLLIFAVDASGSAAMSRLNEAKGAVELLLAEAYAARDHVALISFRGIAADVMLPPTRSLVQTKRRLAELPGGGGTPLAAGLQHAAQMAHQAASRGLSPTVVVLTDGRANIALDGTANRAQATKDADRIAAMLRGQGVQGLVIDMSTRPQAALRTLAALLGAPYLPLPRADAQRLTDAVGTAIGRP